MPWKKTNIPDPNSLNESDIFMDESEVTFPAIVGYNFVLVNTYEYCLSKLNW